MFALLLEFRGVTNQSVEMYSGQMKESQDEASHLDNSVVP